MSGTEPCPDVFHDDEELARSGRIGVLTHTAIGQLAAETRSPTVARLKATADSLLAEFAPIEARAHRQNLASLTAGYFWHLLPPPCWLFAGTELDVGAGRIDLLWRDIHERVLIDEIKTGSPRELGLARTAAQVQRYLDCATALWPDTFVGLRLLCLSDPRRSLLVAPDGGRIPLHDTPYVHTVNPHTTR